MNPVLILGAKGFIGRNLAKYVAGLGVPVAGIGHGAIAPAEMERLGLTEWINGEIDHTNLQQLGNRLGPFSCIFNLAGGSHVGKSFQNPAEDFHRTVTAATHLYEWIRLSAVETPVVVVSSGAVYGGGHAGPISEETSLNPFSPYGAHKAILESLSQSYCSHFGLNIAVCRLFSVYGEGLKKQLIFDLCRKIECTNDKIILSGTGTELRDWIHISDVTRFLWLVRVKCSPELFVVNVGSGVGTSVADVARTVIDTWDRPLQQEFSGHCRPGDPASMIADIAKARSLGFQPEIAIKEGFQRVTDWYRSATQ